jgi:hypothetical protein
MIVNYQIQVCVHVVLTLKWLVDMFQGYSLQRNWNPQNPDTVP